MKVDVTTRVESSYAQEPYIGMPIYLDDYEDDNREVSPPIVAPAPQPSQPVPPVPTQPTMPAQPSVPMQPTMPAQPSVPMQPTMPAQPSVPTQPSPPMQPSMPVQPSVPIQPMPSKPSKPSQPRMVQPRPAKPSPAPRTAPKPMPVPIPMPAVPDDMLEEDDGESIDNYCRNSSFEAWPLAMAYVPWQSFTEVYEPETALKMGTVFPALNLPFLGGGQR